MENLRLNNGTVLKLEQYMVGDDLHLTVNGVTLAECEALFTAQNISRVSLFDANGEYAVFAGFNATVITKDIDENVHVRLLAKTPDRITELETQLLNTQEALADIFEAMEV